MRWDALFEDLEAQLWAEERLNLESEISERARVEESAVNLSDRLRASMGLCIGVGLVTGGVVVGTLAHTGAEALVVNEGRHQVLVPYTAVCRYEGLGRGAQAVPATLRKDVGMARSLRAMARDRAELAVSLVRYDSQAVIHGVMDRVGKDYFELAIVPLGEPRRLGNVSRVWTVPFASLAAIRSLRDSG